jgi:anti-anti-sigma regulatory factor
MDAAAVSTSLAALSERRDAIADAWYRALAPTAFNGRSTAELQAEFGALAGKAVSLLSGESLARAEAEALGAALIELRYASPEALSTTLEILSRELSVKLPPAQGTPDDPLRDRIGALLGALSAGFVRRASATLLREQDRIHTALDTARTQAEEAVRKQQEIILQQLATLRLLSTPLIPLTPEVVVMPLIGAIDAERAAQVLETLLHGIAQHRAKMVILDITGVPAVDAQVADALLRVSHAARLLGAGVMLTGIQPNIARMLVDQGVHLEGIVTHGTLQSGIAQVLSVGAGEAGDRRGRGQAFASGRPDHQAPGRHHRVF